jgi:Fe-S cluster biogenesis protein NfuA
VDDREARARVGRIEELLGELEQVDEPARSLALDTVQAVVELYGEGLRRVVVAGGLGGVAAADEVVSHLLLVHDLHPVPVEARVQEALDGVRPYLGTHGGDVELLGVEDGVARLRLEGTCNGCPSSAVTLRNAIEEAVLRAAPDLERIDAEGVAEPAAQPALLQIAPLTCPTELGAA